MELAGESQLQDTHKNRVRCEYGQFPCIQSNTNIKLSSLSEPTSTSGSNFNHCCRCNEPGRYRPLLGNEGEIMCDVCYREIFALPEVIGEQDNSCNEEEECRICLEIGVMRGCCSQYYCQSCYYKSNRCPGCQRFASLTSIGRDESVSSEHDPRKIFVGISWVITFGVCLIIGLTIWVIVWNEFTFPKTYFGRSCYGFFPLCDIKACIEVSVDELTYDMPSSYVKCSLSSTVYSIIGDACIYDHDLFQKSGKLLGYDFCKSSLREKSLLPPRETVVFYDDFDQWSNTSDYSTVALKSSRWESIYNGETSDVCGYNAMNRIKEYSGILLVSNYSKPASLMFSGVHYRYAETTSFDLPYGGKIEFYLKVAPVASVKSACKTAYGGDINLAYSLDKGNNWIIIAIFEVWKYRKDEFTRVLIEIPHDAFNTNIRFRWQQPSFDPLRDYWALDDISIYRYFSPNHDIGKVFGEKSREWDSNIDISQCCINSELCDQNPDIILKGVDCESYVKGHHGVKDYILRGPTPFLLTSSIANIILILYRWSIRITLKKDLVGKWKKSKVKVESVLFRSWRFEPLVENSWIIFSLAILLLPIIVEELWLLIVYTRHDLYYMLTGSKNVDEVHETVRLSVNAVPSIFSMICAAVIDLRGTFVLIKNVFCARSCWVPLIIIDSSPTVCSLYVGDKQFHLSSITNMNLISKRYSWVIALLYFLGSLPFASTCLSLKFCWMPRDISRILIPAFGWLAVLKSIFGPDIFVKLLLVLPWIFNVSIDKRQKIGLELSKSTTSMIFVIYSSIFFLFGTVCSMLLLMRRVDLSMLGLCSLLSLIFGSIFGLIQGITKGLPVRPFFIMTCWPSRGYEISLLDRLRFPWRYSCSSLNDIYTQKAALIIPFDTEQGHKFRRVLKGNYDG